MLVFEQLAEQFADLIFGGLESFPTSRCCTIELPVAVALSFLLRDEKSSLLERVQQGIHGARAQFVTVAAQFLDHPQSKHVALTRMVEDVKPYQACVEVLMSAVFLMHCPSYPTSLRTSSLDQRQGARFLTIEQQKRTSFKKNRGKSFGCSDKCDIHAYRNQDIEKQMSAWAR